MIRTQEIRKSFGKKEILHGISVDLPPAVYGLLGPNGSGKTTFVRCLLGTYRCGGTVFFDGKPVSKKNPLTGHMGYLPQKFGMYRALRVYEALEYIGTLKRIPAGQLEGEICRCLEAVNLEERSETKVGALSGGMVRRLGIASALLGDPEFMIFDEPTAGLDPEERMRFKNIIRRLSRDKVVLISTHILEDVEAVCDRILIMSKGEILSNEPLAQLAEYARGKVFSVTERELGDLPCEIVRVTQRAEGRVLRILTKEPVPGMEPLEPTVEDGYLAQIKGI